MAMQGVLSGNWSVGNERAKDDAEKKKHWQQMLQAAAMATRMNDKTAIGFGLGALLANNWDKWFGGKGASNNGSGSTNYQYSFAQNMDMAKDPMQMAAAAGDKNAQWVLEHNQPPVNLMAVQQNPAPITAVPMPDNQTVDGVNMQTAIPGNTLQAGVPFTQQLSFNGQVVNDPQKAMMDSNMNPANMGNMFTSAMNNPPDLVADAQNAAAGGLGAFSAPTYDMSALSGAADAVQDNLNFEDWWKNYLGGGR